MNNDTSAMKKPLTKGQILASFIAALLVLAWLAFPDSPKQPESSVEAAVVESEGGTSPSFTVSDAKYIVFTSRKLHNEARELMGDETWEQPANAFSENPIRTWKLKAKGIHDEVFSIYGYEARLGNEGTVRHLVVEGLQKMIHAMLAYEELTAAKAEEARNEARHLMRAEMVEGERLISRAEEALATGAL